ncbi:MAG: NFACT family protein [Pyrinomonadaceae bacterium]
MDDESIKEIVNQICPLLVGRTPGKIFQFGPASLAIDFGLRDAGYLFLSVEPAAPRIYLIKRRVRDLEKQSRTATQFVLALKKELAQTRLVSIRKDPADRIVWFAFAGDDDIGNEKRRALVVQLTGRSANILLLNGGNEIIQTFRQSPSAGVRSGDKYESSNRSPPDRPKKQSVLLKMIRRGEFATPSEAADHYFIRLVAEKKNAAEAASARGELRRRISQQQRLMHQLERDLREHANPEQHKRIGDLLLANLSTAKRNGDRVALIDYFAEVASTISVDVDQNLSLQEEAARRFARYSRSKRAIGQIESRIELVRKQLHELQTEQESLEKLLSESRPGAIGGKLSSSAPAISDIGRSSHLSFEPVVAGDRKKVAVKRIPGTRRYISSDGLEILVGRTSNDNDHLTFKIARPNDLWLHAADYGGSHVVIRRSTRKEVPHQTIVEAAQLAAWFSQAKKSPKVDVHHTERKFVSKPKGAKPGLVRLQRFKNITVKPKEGATRL